MTQRYRSAERRVAEFLSQNKPAPVKRPEQSEPDLFAAAEKDKATEWYGEMGIKPDPDTTIITHRSRLPDQYIEQPPVAHDSATSRAAADTIAPTRRSKMFLVYHHIKAEGSRGATRQEIVDALAISLQTVCSLVNTLYTMGLVGSNAGDVRANRISGCDNEVMLHEDHVTRWNLARQARPAERPNWERGK
jgi:hypothetical protein